MTGMRCVCCRNCHLCTNYAAGDTEPCIIGTIICHVARPDLDLWIFETGPAEM
jgi:hypothetical protein